MRLAPTIAIILLVGCTNDIGAGRARDAGTLLDALAADGTPQPEDATSPGEDAGSLDASAPDAAASPDAFTSPDAGPSCTPAYDCASCCGPAPDGCGHSLACDPCVDDIWCAPSTARFAGQVQAAVQSVMDTRPELFDPVMFRDTSSWLVIDDAAYTAAVVAACNTSGLVCISDPNDDHEVRVRASGDRLAENYGVRVHSSNRTWYRFMNGVCETTLF